MKLPKQRLSGMDMTHDLSVSNELDQESVDIPKIPS